MRLSAKRLFYNSKSARKKLREKIARQFYILHYILNCIKTTVIYSEEIPAKYRAAGKLTLVNFVNEIVNLTADRQIAKVSKDWFSEFEI